MFTNYYINNGVMLNQQKILAREEKIKILLHCFHGANPVAKPMTENKKYIFLTLHGYESSKLMEN
jgi:hypothetical protein